MEPRARGGWERFLKKTAPQNLDRGEGQQYRPRDPVNKSRGWARE